MKYIKYSLISALFLGCSSSKVSEKIVGDVYVKEINNENYIYVEGRYKEDCNYYRLSLGKEGAIDSYNSLERFTISKCKNHASITETGTYVAVTATSKDSIYFFSLSLLERYNNIKRPVRDITNPDIKDISVINAIDSVIKNKYPWYNRNLKSITGWVKL